VRPDKDYVLAYGIREPLQAGMQTRSRHLAGTADHLRMDARAALQHQRKSVMALLDQLHLFGRQLPMEYQTENAECGPSRVSP
jgi:hypothetical protein